MGRITLTNSRLTTFHNDPVERQPAVRRSTCSGRGNGRVLVRPLLFRPQAGQGTSAAMGSATPSLNTRKSGISSELTTYVAMDAPVKFVTVKFRNRIRGVRDGSRLPATGNSFLVNGAMPISCTSSRRRIPKPGRIFARNAYGSPPLAADSCLRRSSELRNGLSAATAPSSSDGTAHSRKPGGAWYRVQLSGKTGAGLDPCAAIQTPFELEDGQEREIVFHRGGGPREPGRGSAY